MKPFNLNSEENSTLVASDNLKYTHSYFSIHFAGTNARGILAYAGAAWTPLYVVRALIVRWRRDINSAWGRSFIFSHGAYISFFFVAVTIRTGEWTSPTCPLRLSLSWPSSTLMARYSHSIPLSFFFAYLPYSYNKNELFHTNHFLCLSSSSLSSLPFPSKPNNKTPSTRN